MPCDILRQRKRVNHDQVLLTIIRSNEKKVYCSYEYRTNDLKDMDLSFSRDKSNSPVDYLKHEQLKQRGDPDVSPDVFDDDNIGAMLILFAATSGQFSQLWYRL